MGPEALADALRLMVITDDTRDGADGLLSRAAAAVRGGATMVQLRLKGTEARVLVELTRSLVAALPVPVIVNDRADVAIAAGAAGVHLGADDIPVAAVRALAPQGFVIGASLGSDDEAPNARGADYVGIGPVFATSSKIDAGGAIGVAEFVRLQALGGRPAVGIGGITAANARAVITAGGTGVAVIAAVMRAASPEAAARALREAMHR
jgi:thiamine-phosphate pyrophosphorylase